MYVNSILTKLLLNIYTRIFMAITQSVPLGDMTDRDGIGSLPSLK